MWDDPEITSLLGNLQRVQAHEGLSDASRAQARDLAQRLNCGVRIVLLGPRGAGKSTLCDAILNRPTGPRANGACRIFGPDVAGTPKALTGAVERTELVETPFGRVQVIDLQSAPDTQMLSQLTTAALDYADIVLWCTQSFGPEEAALWQAAPDALKDHSFLVLTKADLIAEKGALQGLMARLAQVVSEEFHSLYPVSVMPVQTYLEQGGSVPDDRMAASGLKALIDAVRGVVHAGQRADQDSALLFLERHGDILATAQAAEPSARAVAASSAPLSNPAAPRHRRAEVFGTVRGILDMRALDLVEMGFDQADGDMTDVLELCESIIQEVFEASSDALAEVPELSCWAEVFEEACDKVTLTATENDTGSAADAVTILVQIKRDLDQLAIH